MTTDRTLPPPKTAPFFKCSNEWCDKTFQAYHGKVGCKCYDCDDVTPLNVKKPS